MLASKSPSRPGSDASPRSFDAGLPIAALNSTTWRSCSRMRAATSSTENSYGDMNSTPRKPARAAAPKRSRNGTSLNIIDRLAAKRGIVCVRQRSSNASDACDLVYNEAASLRYVTPRAQRVRAPLHHATHSMSPGSLPLSSLPQRESSASEHRLVTNLAGERVELLASRALLWPAQATLFVADVHLGKAAAFRAGGVPVPRGATGADLQRLSALVASTGARRLVVLGDF